MAYTKFENLESGLAPNTVKGRLPNDTSWEAFAYRKAITVNVVLSGGGIQQHDLTGQWQVRLYDNSARAPDGHLTGTVLFEQTITWTARVTSLSEGGIGFITWAPLGDGGAGRQQTSMVNGTPRATVQNINDPAQAAALEIYGHSGAWQDVDSALILPTEAPGQKYAAEAGFSLFTDEAVSTVGGYHFFAVWQSPYYLIDVPPGAVLDTVFDTWQGSVLTEALYSVSGREGGKNLALLDGRTGAQFRILTQNGQTRALRSRHTESPLPLKTVEWSGVQKDGTSLGAQNPDGLISSTPFRATAFHRHTGSVLMVLGSTGQKMRLYQSHDEGKTWKLLMDQTSDITILAACPIDHGSTYIAYGTKNDPVKGKVPAYAILKHDDGSWLLHDSGLATLANSNQNSSANSNGVDANTLLPTAKINSLEAGEGGTVRLLATGTGGELLLFYSQDGKTYQRTPLSTSTGNGTASGANP